MATLFTFLSWGLTILTLRELVMLRLQLGCERRFNIEFYGADSHFCHSAYITWSHMELWLAHLPARLSHFCCRTHLLRRDLRVKCSSDVSCLQKNILFMSVATLKPVWLECYLPRPPGTKSSREIRWYKDMHVCHLTWRELMWCEDSVSPALVFSISLGHLRSTWRASLWQCTLPPPDLTQISSLQG